MNIHNHGETNMRNRPDHRLEEPDFISSLGRAPRSELKLLPARAGVYYAIDDGARVWYVGQSKNLRERLLGHEKLALFDARKVTYIAYILLEESELDQWEQKSRREILRSPEPEKCLRYRQTLR